MADLKNTLPNRPISVLLAEDDEELRFILSHALVKGGYLVHAAKNAANVGVKIEALQKSLPENRRFDVIVSDIQLADGSVIPLLFKHRKFISTFPTILITSDKNLELLKQARQLDIADVLGKPFDLPVLFATIGRAILARPN